MKKIAALFLASACTFGAIDLPAQEADPFSRSAQTPAARPPDPVPTDGEYLIIVGGVSLMEWEKYKAQPHDNWWANFVRAARIRTQQIRAAAPNVQLTWLVYRPGYVERSKQEKRDLLPFIASVRDALNFKLVYFDTAPELIAYLNNGRATTKICGLEFFGHSNKACWMFDYSNNLDSGSKCWLHEKELKQINRGIFARDAFIKSWSCYSGELFVKSWYSATGTRMWGAIGKTQYMTDELPAFSTPAGHWMR
jgi:hypothetical protein